MIMDFSVNLNFDFNGPSMENAVNDPNQAGKANLTNNQTLISPSQQITASTSFNNHNSSNVETVDLSSGIVGTANSKEFQLNSENNNQMLGNRNVKANEMEAISNTTMTQSNQTVTSTNTQKNNMNNTSVNENYKTNTTMESMGKNDIPSIANKNENSNQTKMDMSNDSNKSISINGKNTVQSEIKNIGNSKENSLDIKMNNNTNTGMNGNTSMAGTEKTSMQEESSSQITIETLGDDFPNTTIESISTEKAQVINTDEGGFKSLQVETVKVDEKDMEETGGIIGGIVSFFTELINEIEELVNSWRESISAWWNEEVAPLFKDISDKIGDFLIGTASTIVTGVISIYEGILSFGEAIFDTGVIVLTALASVGTGFFDLCQALYGSVTGEEWESVTKKMWDGTMGFVATEQVKSLFDDFYENTEIGQFLKENTNLFGIIDFNTIRSIGSGIGYTTGVVALTVLTFGVGGAAISGSSITVNATQLATTAGIAGFGRGTESAWKDGASLGEGFLFGGLNAVWEGFQFYIGGKIGGIGNAGNTFLGYSTKGFENQFVNALVRITLDGLDGGLEGFVQPIMATVYKDGYTTSEGEYVEFTSDTNFFERATKLFDSYGGWGNVATQAFIGSAMSMMGEGFDLRKHIKGGQEVRAETGLIDETKISDLKMSSLETLDENLEMNSEIKINAESPTVDKAKPISSADLENIKKEWSNKILDATTDLDKFRDVLSKVSSIKGFETLNDLNSIKTQMVDALVESGKIKEIDNNFIFSLTRDPVMFERLIDTSIDSVTNLLTKNLDHLSGLLVPSFKDISFEKFDTVFTNPNMLEYLKGLSDENYTKIIKQFSSSEVYKWLDCKTLTDRLTSMQPTAFFESMKNLNLYDDIKNAVEGNNSNVYDFLETILDKYYTKDVMLSPEILSDKLNWNKFSSMLPYISGNERYNGIEKAYFAMKDFLDKEVITALEKETYVPYIRIDTSLYLKDTVHPQHYYKILVENDGIEEWLEVKPWSHMLSLTTVVDNNRQNIINGKFKIKDIVKDDLKSSLVLDETHGLEKGIAKCELILDGKPTSILVEVLSDDSLDLNYKVKPKESAQFVSIEHLESQNQVVESLDDIYEITYKSEGKTQTTYLSPTAPKRYSNNFTAPTIDLDKWMISHQVVDFKLESIKKLDKPEIQARLNEKGKYTHVEDLFSKEKYGGNQSDVSKVVNRVFEKVVKGEALTVQEKIKIFYLGKVAKKYFPDLDDIDLVNLADKYSSSGCAYMALANAFSTYVLKDPNGANWFRNTVGFDIGYIMSDGKKYYNTDILAWDMFLNYWSKKSNGDVKTALNRSGGVSSRMLDDLLETYFDDKGISVKTNSGVIMDNKNTNILLLEKLLNSSPNSYNILCARTFDLELLQGLENAKKSTDAALANAETVGKIQKDIGGHAMLITDIDENNDLIVSSWSRKYKFLSESIDKAKSNGKSSHANIWNIEFTPKDSAEVNPIDSKNIIDPFRPMESKITNSGTIQEEVMDAAFFSGKQKSITEVLKNNNFLQGQLKNVRTVINNIDYKHPGEGIKRIEKYLMDGNLNHITRSYGCREYIKYFKREDLTKMLNMIIDTDNLHAKLTIPNNLTPNQAQVTYNNLYNSIVLSKDYHEYKNYVEACKQQGIPYYYNYQFLEIENQLQQLLNQFSFQKKYFSLKTNNDIFNYFGNIGDKLFPKLISEVDRMSSLSSTPINAHDLSKIKDINYLDYIFANPSKNIQNHLKSIAHTNSKVSSWDKKSITNYIKNSQQGAFLSKLTVGEVLAVYEYTCGSGTILKYLTGHPIDVHFRIKDPYILNTIINGLDSSIKKFGGLKNNMILYRGDSFSKLSLWKGWNVSKPSDLLKYIGQTISCDTYMSTGVSKSGSFSGEVKWIIKAPIGTKGMYINDISKYFSTDVEFEYIVNRGSKFRIDEVYSKHGITYIKAKIVE